MVWFVVLLPDGIYLGGQAGLPDMNGKPAFFIKDQTIERNRSWDR